MQIQGRNFIGSERSASGQVRFRAQNPHANATLEPAFVEATADEVDRALSLAAEAALPLQRLSAEAVAEFLHSIAGRILSLGDALLEKAHEETALGPDRLRGERDRTTNQLKLFAELAAEGSWVDARIDTALPDRKPLPRPDLRRLLQPIGPVVVFGASNFPLAFSVAGGDTASAFAARNPVVVKAHPAHPGTSELVASAIAEAVREHELPPGTFSLLHGQSPEPSLALAQHPRTRAVAFTGSLRAGRALFDAAAQRPEPIPVFAEMGSVNPVFMLEGALAKDPELLAEGLHKSVLLGVGQFCTSPGLVFALTSNAFDLFAKALSQRFAQASPGTMLNGAIANGYREAFERAARVNGITALSALREGDPARTEGRPGVLMADAATWLAHRELHEEIFGPATIIVRCSSNTELLTCARALEGTLTATIHGTSLEPAEYPELIQILTNKAGRLIFNGYPTGVEVGPAMQHGGPYPASTDSRFTSVGTAAIYRFARPVCFQNFPEQQLPPELRNANTRNIWRTVNGHFTRDPIR